MNYSTHEYIIRSYKYYSNIYSLLTESSILIKYCTVIVQTINYYNYIIHIFPYIYSQYIYIYIS